MLFRVTSIVGVLGTVLLITGCSSSLKNIKERSVAVTSKPTTNVLALADFDSGTAPNNLGGGFGAWDKDPEDDTQGCKVDFYSPGYDGTGKCIKLIYDVDSSNPAYNGFWMKLESVDARPFSKLSFWIKGDEEADFTTRIKVELKNGEETSPYYVNDICDSWDVIEIPLSSFDRITDWSKMTEFVIVFEDTQATRKSGVIYVDEICFVK